MARIFGIELRCRRDHGSYRITVFPPLIIEIKEGLHMGFRYRKSINFGGGFRINLSKSGIGYSWGVKGFPVPGSLTLRKRARETERPETEEQRLLLRSRPLILMVIITTHKIS